MAREFSWGVLTTYKAMKLPEREYPESTISWQRFIKSLAEFTLSIYELGLRG
jgi:hypothetical protein